MFRPWPVPSPTSWRICSPSSTARRRPITPSPRRLRRLQAADYRELSETEIWELAPGDRRYVVRDDGSLVAFEVGAISPADGGFRIVGAHTDSPNLRIKPLADVLRPRLPPARGRALRRRAAAHLARPRPLAGRSGDAARRGADAHACSSTSRARLLRVPNLAIHLQRELRTEGLKLNAQQHLVPVVGLEDAPALSELLASELRAQQIADVDAGDVLAFDLMTYDVQPAAVSGVRGEFICAPRLDNLASCHAGLTALLDGAVLAGPRTSRASSCSTTTKRWAAAAPRGPSSPLLADVLERIVTGFEGGAPQGAARALARSTLISADMAHAVHPNYADRHEPGHRPVIGEGPVIKQNAGQSYASDAQTAGLFAALCSPRRRRTPALRHRAATSPAGRPSARSPPRGSASAPSTSATRCCRCTRVARWPARRTSSR